MDANTVADLLDEVEEITCPCGYTQGIGGKCLRCGLDQSRTEAWDEDDLEGFLVAAEAEVYEDEEE